MKSALAHPGPQQKLSSNLRLLFPILLTALAVRMVVVYFSYTGLPDADKNYEQFGWEVGWIARALASGRGFSSPFFPWSGPTALVPPVYPFLLSLVFRLTGIYTLTSGFIILSINSVLSTLTAIPVYFSAKYALDTNKAKAAAWIWALYPFAIYFSAGRVWEYALTSLLYTTAFCIAQRIGGKRSLWTWIGLGVLLGATGMCNPATLIPSFFLLLFLGWRELRAGRSWFVKCLLCGVMVLAVLTPWAIRCYQKVGVFCVVRDNFWHEFYTGNSGDTSSPMPLENHPASDPVEMKRYLTMGEKDYLADAKVKAKAWVSAHKGEFALLTMRRVVFYWTAYWSFDKGYMEQEPTELANMFHCAIILVLLARGLWRSWKARAPGLGLFLVLIGIHPIAYYFSHPLMDFRQPIEPAIVVLMAAGAMPWRLRSGRQAQADTAAGGA